jgi:hypothetical protein
MQVIPHMHPSNNDIQPDRRPAANSNGQLQRCDAATLQLVRVLNRISWVTWLPCNDQDTAIQSDGYRRVSGEGIVSMASR